MKMRSREQFATKSYDDLIRALKNSDPCKRLEVVRALGELRDPRAAVSLIEAVADQDKYVSQEAMFALGKMRGKIIDQLIDGLKHPNWLVRRSTAIELGANCQEAAKGVDPLIDALIAEIKGESGFKDQVIREMANALVDIGEPSVQPLKERLDREKNDVIQALLFEILQTLRNGNEIVDNDRLYSLLRK